jgi:hypothetical protein
MDQAQFIERYEYEAHRLRRNAADALHRLIADAESALRYLDEGQIRTSIGGDVLNVQNFQDAERSLVRWWDAEAVVALSKGDDS